MIRMRTSLFLLLVIAVLSSPGLSSSAAESPAAADAAALLKQVSQTYSSLRSYHFEGVTVLRTQSDSARSEQEVPFVFAEVRPSKIRFETKSSLTATLFVSDGDTTWTYMPRLHEYTHKRSSTGDGAAQQPAPFRNQNPVAEYERLADYAPVARVIRQEGAMISGREIPCWVVELPGAPETANGVQNFPRLLWIEKERSLVLRDVLSSRVRRPYTPPSEQIRTCTFTLAKINEPLPDPLFQFVPPDGAREVSELSLSGGSKLAFAGSGGMKARVSTSSAPAGSPASSSGESTEATEITSRSQDMAEAPDFTLSALQGGEVRLRDLRGKIVLLDFWASWCGPCRKELPVIEKLHRDYNRRGVVVLGVNDENPETSQRYVQANNYSFSTLVDSKRAVHRTYSVTAIPTVYIIDRKGRVAAHFVGARGEPELLGALRQAGLE